MSNKEIDIETSILEAIHKARENPELKYAIFQAGGVFFILGEDDIVEISDDASCGPHGGWFPALVTGLSNEEHEFFEQIMKKFGIDETFFDEVTGEAFDDLIWDDDYVEECFENQDDNSLKIYKNIKKLLDSGKTPFASLNELVVKLKRFNLDYGSLYYWWEDYGDYIELYDNIVDTGESRGEFDSLDDEEWVEILKNLEKYVVKPDKEVF